MKKLGMISCLVLSSLLLFSCAADKEKEAVKKAQDSPIQLVKEDDSRLVSAKAMSDNLVAFDYQLPQDAKRLILWLDTFEDGKEIDSLRVFEENQPAKTGLILFATQFISGNEITKDLMDESHLTIKTVVNVNDEGESKLMEVLDYQSSGSVINNDFSKKTGDTYPLLLEEYVLSEETGNSGLSHEFMFDPEANLVEVSPGKKVYLYRLEFR